MKTLQNLKSFCVQCVLFTLFVTPILYAVLAATELSSWNRIPALIVLIWTSLSILLLNKEQHKYIFSKDSKVLSVINIASWILLLISILSIPFALYLFIVESGKMLTIVISIMSVCFFLYKMLSNCQ